MLKSKYCRQLHFNQKRIKDTANALPTFIAVTTKIFKQVPRNGLEKRLPFNCDLSLSTSRKNKSARQQLPESASIIPPTHFYFEEKNLTEENRSWRGQYKSGQDANISDKSDEDSITVWHGSHYDNCVALKSIDGKNYARLQHHFKYCSTYCVFHQVLTDVEKRDVSNGNINKTYKKELHLFQSKQAQHLCELSAKNSHEFTSTESELSEMVSHLFERAAQLSEKI